MLCILFSFLLKFGHDLKFNKKLIKDTQEDFRIIGYKTFSISIKLDQKNFIIDFFQLYYPPPTHYQLNALQ